MKRIIINTLLLFSALSSFAQGISEPDSSNNAKQPDFNGWTEEQIRHYEDSLINKLYPPVYEMTLDSISRERITIENENHKNTTHTTYSYPVLTSYGIDDTQNVGDIPIQSGSTPSGAKTYTIPIEVYQGMREMQQDFLSPTITKRVILVWA